MVFHHQDDDVLDLRKAVGADWRGRLRARFGIHAPPREPPLGGRCLQPR
jgi:hypothetical protein